MLRLDRDLLVYTLRGMITFDGRKRKANIAKHGIDLAEVESAFDSPMVTIEDDRVAYGEQRLKSLAWWNGRVVVLLWTERDSGAHVFSCQDADKSQTRQYVKAITGR
jgi:uncharacterized DUF497 family protein